MRRVWGRLGVRQWLLPVVCALAQFAGIPEAWPQDRQKQVLVLYATRQDAQIAIVGERELPRILEQGLGSGIDYHSEYIDRARFPDPTYHVAVREFFRLKYKENRFDVVIAMNDIALEFIDENRNDLFPETPVVFFASAAGTRRLANSTGVVVPLNLSGTLALATELQPDIQRVYVVTGAHADERRYEAVARAQFQSFEPRLTFTYLTGLPTNELEAQLAALPAHSIIYYLTVSRDAAGENFHPLEYLDRLAAVANAPIYSWVDSAMDHGIVGGSLKNQKSETEAVGRLARRVLQAEAADSIPIASPDLNVRQVDWRQIRRWRISEARIPAGVLVRFREPSVWDRYKAYIVSAVALFILQSALIGALLVQRARRRQAEENVVRSEAALRASYERIRDLGGRLLQAQEGERARIARELHDDISQQMALLEIDLELLTQTVRGDAGNLADEVLHRAQGISRGVHDLSHRLHPGKLRLIGLVAALEGLQRELTQPHLAIRFTHAHIPAALPFDQTLCLFRIVQEALHNALKYSAAHEVIVDLRVDSGRLLLIVVDDGTGFDVQAAWGKGLGLVSMGERVEAIGGTFEIHSRPGEGTRVHVSLPVAQVRASDEARPGGAARAAGEMPRADSA
jgi:signal transduction histidine kinase